MMKPVPMLPPTTDDASSVVSSGSSTPSSKTSSGGSYVHNPYGSVCSKEFVNSPVAAPEKMEEKKKKKGAGKLAWVIAVQFKFGRTGRFYSNQEILKGTFVVVQADRGQDMGVVCGSEVRTPAHSADKGIQKILKHANEAEIRKWAVELSQEESDAVMEAQAMIDRQGVNLTVVHAEFQFDVKKLTFHFTSKDAHPNFRVVLDEAFSKWKCRIWFARYSRVATDIECRKRLAA